MDINFKRLFQVERLKEGSFLANVAVLMTGSVISQMILIAASPVLTRLYSPADFGIFGLYVSIISIAVSVLSWKYEVAIMLPKKDEDAKALVFLSVMIAFVMSCLMMLLIVVFKDQILRINRDIGFFLYLLPPGAFINALILAFTAWNSRMRCYNNISISKVSQTSTTMPIQISSKAANLFENGLVWGSLAGSCVNLIVLLYKSAKTDIFNLRAISKRRLLLNAYKYRDFPRYQSFACLINAFIDNIVILLMLYFYNPQIVGFFVLTSRVLMLPAAFIGQSVRDVYYQRASNIFATTKDIRELARETTLGLIKLYIVPMLILLLFSPMIFGVLFGNKWVVAGHYAQIMSVFIFSTLINVPAVCSGHILNQQKFILIIFSLYLILIVAGICTGYYIFHNHYISILLYSIAGLLLNTALITYIFKKIAKAAG